RNSNPSAPPRRRPSKSSRPFPVSGGLITHTRRTCDFPSPAIASSLSPALATPALSSAAPSAPLLFDSAFLAKLEQLHLLARKLFRGEHRAERRSRQVGSSLEFADYRNYAWGDDPRMIDWAVYARLDRLFVKLFEQERDLDVHFLVDCSGSMRWSPTANGERP